MAVLRLLAFSEDLSVEVVNPKLERKLLNLISFNFSTLNSNFFLNFKFQIFQFGIFYTSYEVPNSFSFQGEFQTLHLKEHLEI